MTSPLQILQALEVELHQHETRGDFQRLEQLLHPEFYEVGRSGRTYHRDAVVKLLCAAGEQPTVKSEAFAVQELGSGAALLTYRSAHVELDGSLVNHTLRSSVWVKTSTDWQLRYHQGTPAAEEW